MKHLFFILLSSLCFSAFSQRELIVSEAPRLMSRGMQPAFLVEIPEVTLKQVEKNWLKFLSATSKEKSTIVNGENLQTGIIIKNISPNPFAVYSKLVETSAETRLIVWFTENDTVFFSKELNSDQQLAVQKYLYDFALQEYQLTVEDELNVELNDQKRLEDELVGLVKDEEESVKKISENERLIGRENDAIVTNNADINSISLKIESQKGMVTRTASDPNATKGAKKTLRSLESEKERLQKLNERCGVNIDTWNKEIREEETIITDMKEKRASTVLSIEKQKQKVQEVQLKKERIQ